MVSDVSIASDLKLVRYLVAYGYGKNDIEKTLQRVMNVLDYTYDEVIREHDKIGEEVDGG